MTDLTPEAIDAILQNFRECGGFDEADTATAIAALEAVNRVRALHTEGKWLGRNICEECNCPWPCPTIAALEGEVRND